MPNQNLTRQELYDRLWAKPATKVASELGISDVGLLKVCERHNIPKPPKGHWAKIAVGKPSDRPPLPPAATPELEQMNFGQDTAAGSTQSKEDAAFPSISVAERLASPHPMVANASVHMKGEKARSDGLVYCLEKNAMRIAVTVKNVGRALRIMDAFVKAIETKGFEVVEKQGVHAYADVGIKRNEMFYPVKLREHVQRTALVLTPQQQEELKKWGFCTGDRYSYAPNGRLIFTTGEDYAPIICQDTANTRLEDKLGYFVGRILQRAAEDEESARRRAEEQAARERLLAERRRQEEEAARLRKEEEGRINQLKDEIARWRLCHDIEDYLRDIRQLIASNRAQITRGGSMDRWFQWAEAYAAKIDPMRDIKSELEKMKAKSLPEQADEL